MGYRAFTGSAGGSGGGAPGSMLDVSGTLVSAGQSYAAANAAVIQAALNSTAGTNRVVAILTPGTYHANQIVMPSNSALYIGADVVLRKPDNYNLSMIVNFGALQGTPTRDQNIAITGPGTIDGNAANNGAGLTQVASAITVNTFLYGIQGEIAMINVDGFELAIGNPYNGNGFFCQFHGTSGYFHDMNVETTRDFLHIGGGTSGVKIENCHGYASDDFIALNAWDWHRSSPQVGDIANVRIKNVSYKGSRGLSGVTRSGALLKLLPGTRTTGAGTGTGNIYNVTLDGFDVAMATTAAAPTTPAFSMLADFDQTNGAEYSGAGVIHTVKVSNGNCTLPNNNVSMLQVSKTISGTDADGQCSLTLKNVVFEGIHVDASGGVNGFQPVNIQMQFNTLAIEGLTFRDCEWTPYALGSDQAFVTTQSKATLGYIEVDGLTINSSAATGAVAALFVNNLSGGSGTVVDMARLDRIRTAPGYQLGGAWLTLNGGINRLLGRGIHITGPAGGNDGQGIHLTSANAFVKYGNISDSMFNGVKANVSVDNASATGFNCTFEECQMLSSTHPVFMNGNFSANVTFRGGLVDTPTNLARVDTGTLVMALDGTTSSGAGGTTATIVNSGKLRLRKSDQVSFGAAVVLTNQAAGDRVLFSGTPAWAGIGTVTGSGAGLYLCKTASAGAGSVWSKETT